MKHVLNTSETQTEQSVIDDRRRQEIQDQGQKRRRDKEKLEPRPQVNTERREQITHCRYQKMPTYKGSMSPTTLSNHRS